MSSSPTESRLPRLKQDRVLATLREQIVSGHYRPGDQLPLRGDLLEEHGVSNATLQTALSRLMEDGFVHSRGRLGTFVTDHPPHLNRYAICFPRPPRSGATESRFWARLVDEARRREEPPASMFTFFRGVSGDDSRAGRELAGVMAEHVVAGPIFAFPPAEEMADAELLSRAPAACVITTDPDAWSVPAVVPDLRRFADRVLDRLAERGRRRLAVVTVTGTRADDLGYLRRTAIERGFQCPEAWVQCVGWPETGWAGNVAKLLVRHPEDRPDGLVILDDNVAAETVRGLAEAGIDFHDDLAVIAHANFPDPEPLPAPVERLGFDAGDFLDAALAAIDAGRRGDDTPATTRIAPRFASEIDRD